MGLPAHLQGVHPGLRAVLLLLLQEKGLASAQRALCRTFSAVPAAPCRRRGRCQLPGFAQCRRAAERGRRPAAAPAIVRLKARNRGCVVRAETQRAASVETTAEMIQRCPLRQPMRQTDVIRTPQAVAACRPAWVRSDVSENWPRTTDAAGSRALPSLASALSPESRAALMKVPNP